MLGGRGGLGVFGGKIEKEARCSEDGRGWIKSVQGGNIWGGYGKGR